MKNDDEMRDLERRIRSWTHRPPALAPRAARARVLARLDGGRPRPVRRLAVAFLALAALAAGSLVLKPGQPAAPPAAEPSRGLLVYELESGTKVYFDLAARPAQGDEK